MSTVTIIALCIVLSYLVFSFYLSLIQHIHLDLTRFSVGKYGSSLKYLILNLPNTPFVPYLKH